MKQDYEKPELVVYEDLSDVTTTSNQEPTAVVN